MHDVVHALAVAALDQRHQLIGAGDAGVGVPVGEHDDAPQRLRPRSVGEHLEALEPAAREVRRATGVDGPHRVRRRCRGRGGRVAAPTAPRRRRRPRRCDRRDRQGATTVPSPRSRRRAGAPDIEPDRSSTTTTSSGARSTGTAGGAVSSSITWTTSSTRTVTRVRSNLTVGFMDRLLRGWVCRTACPAGGERTEPAVA